MTDPIPLGVLCGLALGLGLWLLLGTVPRLSRPRLASRVAPYVVDVSASARDLLDRAAADPLPVLQALVQPLVGRLRRIVNGMLGGADVTALRLRQAGLAISVDEFRTRQLLWAAGGGVVAIAGGIVVGATQAVPFGAPAAFVVVAAVAGFLLRDHLLQRAARARMRRMASELPTVLEFLTLSLSAGEGILDATRRIARISRGELAAELSSVPREVSTGVPLVESLEQLSDALQLAPLTRAIDQVTGAIERGTPLAEVLRAQAQDSRETAKRELLELSGKKEVAMLVPLVFLILPVTIAIAIFPGLFVLQLGFG
jgi:tight adherence protein C